MACLPGSVNVRLRANALTRHTRGEPSVGTLGCRSVDEDESLVTGGYCSAREAGCKNDQPANQSGLAPESFTTLPHFSVSSAIRFPKSAGEPTSTVPPRSASRALSLGSARPALISLLSLPMISAAAFFDTPTP